MCFFGLDNVWISDTYLADTWRAKIAFIINTRKCPLRGYFLGVLTHTTAWTDSREVIKLKSVILKLYTYVHIAWLALPSTPAWLWMLICHFEQSLLFGWSRFDSWLMWSSSYKMHQSMKSLLYIDIHKTCLRFCLIGLLFSLADTLVDYHLMTDYLRSNSEQRRDPILKPNRPIFTARV